MLGGGLTRRCRAGCPFVNNKIPNCKIEHANIFAEVNPSTAGARKSAGMEGLGLIERPRKGGFFGAMGIVFAGVASVEV